MNYSFNKNKHNIFCIPSGLTASSTVLAMNLVFKISSVFVRKLADPIGVQIGPALVLILVFHSCSNQLLVC